MTTMMNKSRWRPIRGNSVMPSTRVRDSHSFFSCLSCSKPCCCCVRSSLT
jgi:hypothetical protein